MTLHDLELTVSTGSDGSALRRGASLEREILNGAVFSGLTTAEQKAIAITSTLETGRRGGFSGLSGNFDGQGISFGLVNWNLGTGSLQHLLRDFARDFPARFSAVFGPHAKPFEALIRPADAKSVAAQLAFAIREMNVKVGKKWKVREPWKGYFARLAADPEFMKIQVRYVRDLLARADYFCRYFGLKSERAFCFMFDAVSSHGKWWLQKKTNGVERRREILKQKLALLRLRVPFGEIPEDATLNAVAETLRDVSLDRWKERVYARKRWFLTGKHAREKELRGLEPRAGVPYALSTPPGAAKPANPVEKEFEAADTNADPATRAVSKLIAAGERNADRLATEAFYALHPERNRAPIRSEERTHAAEWRALRSGLVAKLLRNAGAGGAAPPPTEQSAAGTTHYVEIPLEIEGKAPPLTGIFTPSGYRHGPEVDLILYLHGHKAGHYPDGASMAIDRYWGERTRPRAALREAVHASRKNAILVAPTLGPESQAHTLAKRGGLDAYLARVMHALAAQKGWQGGAAPRLRHLILAAHSGGGIWMLSLANGKDRAVTENLRECWGFDCFYHPDVEVAGWPAWARRFPDKQLFAYDATDATHQGKPIGPRTVAKRLRAKGISNLRLSLAKKQGDHFGVLRDHFLERIAQSSHLSQIPDASGGR
jgi:hypothetical protein